MQPQTPKEQYDFILKDGQTAKKGLKLPIPNLPKPVLMAMGGIVGIFIVILLVGAVTGGKGVDSQAYIKILARAQEINRVSTAVEQLAQDADTQNLATTASVTMTSDQQQLTSYLAAHKVKISAADLGLYKSTNTDSQMAAASANGNLPTAYATYLKAQLVSYDDSLQTAFNKAGNQGKIVVKEAYTSSQVLQKSSQLASN